MREKTFISGVESGQNNIPYEIFNLEDKDDQAIIEEIKETYHNFSPEDSNQNDALLTEYFKNNSHTRSHAVEPPHGVEIDCKDEDINFKEGTDENIGHQERNFVSKFKVAIGSNPFQ